MRFRAGASRTRPAPLEETLIQPTLLGGLTAALPEGSTRLMSNTDQATVPLIDFDLSGADLPLTTRPGAAGAGAAYGVMTLPYYGWTGCPAAGL